MRNYNSKVSCHFINIHYSILNSQSQDESYFWLEFIIDEELLKNELVEQLLKEANELTAMFIASRKTARRKD